MHEKELETDRNCIFKEYILIKSRPKLTFFTHEHSGFTLR